MPFQDFRSKSPTYAELPSNDDLSVPDTKSPLAPRKRQYAHSIVLYSSFFVFGFVVSAALGFFSRLDANATTGFGINSKTPLPRDIFSRHQVPFVPDERYIGPSKAVNKNWQELTKGSDSIYLPDPADYNLTDPGINAPFFIFSTPPEAALPLSRNFYVLSPLHQLHCVNVIRKRYNHIVYSPQSSSSAGPLSGSPEDEDWLTHIEHCLEYLRLSITCGDPFVLESDSPPGTPEPLTRDGLGWGVVHQCIDWNLLINYQEEMVGKYNASWASSNKRI